MQRYVHSQNVTRYVELLESEADPATVEQIQKLLIEEENRFGSLAERIDEADRLIRDAQARLNQQKSLLQRLGNDGHDTTRAAMLMRTMERTLQLMSDYRRSLPGLY
jgi:hypothetical protein